MPLFRSKVDEKLREAGYDPARLPPGQYLTEKWPVLHAGSVPNTDLATWDFRVFGEVERGARARLGAVPGAAGDRGHDRHPLRDALEPLRRDLQGRALERAREARASRSRRARFVVAHAEQGFTANVPIEALEDPQALLAYEADGEPLTKEHGWPLRLLIPTKYFWKSAKWLRGLELRATDQPGFWERYGYNNNADYWKEERYEF